MSLFKKELPNYYEMLGIEDTASVEMIEKAYRDKEVELIASEDYATLAQLKTGYETLKDMESRKVYDKKIGLMPLVDASEVEEEKEGSHVDHVNASWFSRNKGFIAGTITGIAIGCIIFGATSCHDRKNTEQQPEEIPQEPVVEEPVEEKETKELTTDNFQDKVEAILAANKAQGLTIREEKVNSALFIANLDYLEQEDIAKLRDLNDYNAIEEVTEAYDYMSRVRTYNGTKEDYISVSDLFYDKIDKATAKALDEQYLNLKKSLKDGSMTEEKFQASFETITNFFAGGGYLATSEGLVSNNDLTSGGGLTLETVYWPMFSVTYGLSDGFITKENMIDIKTLSNDVLDGSKYLSTVMNHESLNCQPENTNQKTLTK